MYVCIFFYPCAAGPLVIFPSGGDGSRVRQGDNLTVTCFTGGSDPPATFINITLDGRLLASVGDPIEGQLEFTITDTSLADHGTVYVCTAVNDIGTTSESFSLIVQGMREYRCLLPVCLSLCLSVCLYL